MFIHLHESLKRSRGHPGPEGSRSKIFVPTWWLVMFIRPSGLRCLSTMLVGDAASVSNEFLLKGLG